MYHLHSNDVFFFLLNEKKVKFLKLILQQIKKINLLKRHVFAGGESPAFLRAGGIIEGGANRRIDELKTLFKFLIRQEFVTPFRQCFLDLVAQAFPELHAY